MQLLALITCTKLLWVGVNTTRMQEHGLRHILLLKKAQLFSQGTMPKPLFFSVSKTVEFLVPAAFMLPELNAAIEAQLGISISNQRITVHGLAMHSGGSSAERAKNEKLWVKLLNLKAKGKQQGTLEKKEHEAQEQDRKLAGLLTWFQKDDAMQSRSTLQKCQLALEIPKYQKSEHKRARLKWIKVYLPAVLDAEPDGAVHSPRTPRTRHEIALSKLGRTVSVDARGTSVDGPAVAAVATLQRSTDAVTAVKTWLHTARRSSMDDRCALVSSDIHPSRIIMIYYYHMIYKYMLVL
jgi:hypothetical protein